MQPSSLYRCTISEKHENHTFLNIFDIFKKKQSRFKSDLEKLKKVFAEKYKILLSDVEKQESELEADFKNLKTDISNQKKKWYIAIERHFNNLNSEIAKLENKHRDEMKRCKAKINQNIQKVEQNMEQINGILKSNNISKSLKFQTDFEMEIIPQVEIRLPTFSPLRVPEELVSMWIGSLRFDADKITPRNIKQILPQPGIIASVGTQYTSNLYNVVGYTDRQIWTSGDDCSIKVFHSDQKALLKTFSTLSGHRPESIAIISTGHLVYTYYHERSVNILKDEENYHVIRLENWIPHGVCKTSSGRFLVIMISNDYKQSKVVRFVGFREKQTIFAYRGIPLFSSGDFYRYITENRNLDICVSDHGAGAVVVVNQARELRFRYTGLTPDPKNKPFDPRGITTDSQSHILIADIENHCVHVIDQNGQFLRYVECGLGFPWGL
ncbi:uncharacterized protein LOC134247402 [Saccostrea cucullata]|uniref:uncharacterized protein LOC134247402 n=1 Tax=Saccostrea cuccullata TaxID=36930 RepID=UPI002ED1F680